MKLTRFAMVNKGHKIEFAEPDTLYPLLTTELLNTLTTQKFLAGQKNTSRSFSVNYNPFCYGDKSLKFSIKGLVTTAEYDQLPMNGYPKPILNQEITSLCKGSLFSDLTEFYNFVDQNNRAYVGECIQF